MTQHFTACVPHEGRERRVVVGTVTSMPSNVTWKTNKLCSDSCFKSALCCGVFFGQTFFGFPLQISFVLWVFLGFFWGGDRSFSDWISTHRHPHPTPTFFFFSSDHSQFGHFSGPLPYLVHGTDPKVTLLTIYSKRRNSWLGYFESNWLDIISISWSVSTAFSSWEVCEVRGLLFLILHCIFHHYSEDAVLKTKQKQTD